MGLGVLRWISKKTGKELPTSLCRQKENAESVFDVMSENGIEVRVRDAWTNFCFPIIQIKVPEPGLGQQDCEVGR